MFALASRLCLIALALVAPQSESSKRSPFDQVRWSDDKPQVVVDGKWNAVLAIDDVSIEQLLTTCHALNDRYWQTRFEDDLVSALEKCGHAPGEKVKLQVRDLDGGEPRLVRDVPMTAFNVIALRGAHNALHGLPPIIPRAAREHATEAAPQFAELAHPLRFELGSDVALTHQDAQADLDQLEWLIENRFAHRDHSRLDRKALFDAMRIGIADSITRNEFALQLAKLLACFGDANTYVAGELALPQGSLPFALGEAHGGIVAYKADRTGFVDSEYPFLTRIDGIDLEKWIDVAKRIAPGGAPQLERHDAVRRLAQVGWLRMEIGAAASATVKLELASADRSRTKTLEVELCATRSRADRLEKTATHTLENRLRYVRLSFPPRVDGTDLWPDGLGIGDPMRTDGLVVDARGATEVARDVVRLLQVTLMRMEDEPRVLEVAYYRMEPGAERSNWYAPLDRRGLNAAGGGSSNRDRNAAEEHRYSFVPAWQMSTDIFSESHWLVSSRWDKSYPLLYDKPVVLLCDEQTTGGAEIAVEALQGWRNCAVIGMPTGGANGARLPFRLEHSGLVVQVETVASFRRNGEPFSFHGIEPDVRAERLPTDFIGTTDAQLAAAIDYLRTATSKPR